MIFQGFLLVCHDRLRTPWEMKGIALVFVISIDSYRFFAVFGDFRRIAFGWHYGSALLIGLYCNSRYFQSTPWNQSKWIGYGLYFSWKLLWMTSNSF